MIVTFVDYCQSKNIDPVTFKSNEPLLFCDLEVFYNQVHPDSFTAQKLFLLNDIRRRYHYDKPIVKKVANSAVSVKPKINIGKSAGVKLPLKKLLVNKVAKEVVIKSSGGEVNQVGGDRKVVSNTPIVSKNIASGVVKPKISRPVIKSAISKPKVSVAKNKDLEKGNNDIKIVDVSDKVKKNVGLLKPKITGK